VSPTPARICLLAAALMVAACASKPSGPAATLDAYAAALRDKDYGAAYALMSASFRARYSKDEFVRMMNDSSREAAETAARLRGERGAMEVSAELRYGLGETMRLVQEGGRWRIASNPVQFYGQSTPREALRSFVRAYRLERWDVMLSFVPNSYREHMTVETLREQFEGSAREEHAILMNQIEANIDEPIEDQGNEARMPYGERSEVKFVREDGKWKILDLD
jgi:hypothetical protein